MISNMKVLQKNGIEDRPIDSGYLFGRLECMKKNMEKENSEISSKDPQSESQNAKWRKEQYERVAKADQSSIISSQNFNRVQSFTNGSKKKNGEKSMYKSFLESKSNQRGGQDVVQKQKISNIVKNFIKKISLNVLYGSPVQFQPFDTDVQTKQDDKYGLQLPSHLQHLIFIFSFLHTLVMCVIGSLFFAFKEATKTQWIDYFDMVSIIWLILEIVLGFVRVTYIGSIKLEKLSEISKNYIKNQFIIDFLCVTVLFIDFIFPDGIQKRFVGIIFFLKISDALDKLQKLEVKFLDTTYKEHWWDLLKVFLTNFVFAHILAIILIMMTWINENQNWLEKIGAATAPWYERYSWAYYGGTTIMLTVGFGDIAAGNYQQALCLTVIETLSCIALAYNIHCVGTLISNIRAEEIQKNKKIKLLRNLSEKNDIPQELTLKINNYIEESSIIKNNFNFEENKNFIESLPHSLKVDFLRESHKKVFNILPFFRNLTQNTLVKLAESLEMMITHPDQVILKKKQWEKIMILKNGQIASTIKMKDNKFNHTVIDKISVRDGENPKILSLQFLCQNKEKNYEMKSQTYSILYSLSVEQFHEIIKQFPYDFQYFHERKASQKRNLGQFQVIDCTYCKEKHSRFQCPKLHYVPLKQHVVNKYLYSKNRNSKNQRKQGFRIDKQEYHDQPFYKSLKGYCQMNETMKQTGLSSYITYKTLGNIQEKGISLSEIVEEKKKADSLRQADIVKQIIMSNLLDGSFWRNQSDKLQDYKFYFTFFNPRKINENYRNRKRNLRKEKKKVSEMIMKNFNLE